LAGGKKQRALAEVTYSTVEGLDSYQSRRIKDSGHPRLGLVEEVGGLWGTVSIGEKAHLYRGISLPKKKDRTSLGCFSNHAANVFSGPGGGVSG